MRPCCGNCVYYRPEDMTGRSIAGTYNPTGRCVLKRNESKSRWANENDWCDQHQQVPPPDDNSDLL